MRKIEVGDSVEWTRQFDGRPFEGVVLQIVTPFAIVQPAHDSTARMWPWLDRLTKHDAAEVQHPVQGDDLAETLRDIDGQISGAEDEIYRLRAWREEVVAQLEQATDAAGERDGGGA